MGSTKDRTLQPWSGVRWQVRGLVVALLSALAVAAASVPAKAIVGGERVDYPWAAAFIRSGSTPVAERTYCSGSLVKPTWVLTAGHCRPAVGDTVTIGRAALASAAGQKRTVKRAIYMYNSAAACPSGSQTLCDMALVELNAASTQPDLDLADANEVPDWNAGTRARVYGYGSETTSSGPSSGHLKRAEFEIRTLSDNHYHLTYQGLTGGTCNRDSGSPVIVSTHNGPRVVGVHIRGLCTSGATSTGMKVGSRGSAANSPGYVWIAGTI
ncbi:S1 family peptidase [Solwaraspora sp. WMMB335]|uniref:S1 family peptidase n=1 Tax=Solwaraspora sp. WMMB335 TaxID=3404118 RepID=UPI003B943FB6